jgi:hypothetical protein
VGHDPICTERRVRFSDMFVDRVGCSCGGNPGDRRQALNFEPDFKRMALINWALPSATAAHCQRGSTRRLLGLFMQRSPTGRRIDDAP